MEVTPELLTLLKQLLDICVQEAQRAREDEQTREQMLKIVQQIRLVLEGIQ